MEIKVLFGTETGNAEEAATTIASKLKEANFEATVLDMSQISIEEIKSSEVILISTSTWGDGDAPSNAVEVLEQLNTSSDASLLSGVKYAVFALGDSMYPNFCQAGEDFDDAMKKLGAEQIVELTKNEDDFYQNISPWVESIVSKL